MEHPLIADAAEVLLVEDNPGDVLLVQEALRDSRRVGRLSVVGDGAQALAFLRRRPPHLAAPRPDLILLDLNLPCRTGQEVLEEIKRDPHFRRIPVVVLTSSEAEKDVQRCYDLGANSYVVKPHDLDRFAEAIRSIEEFWLANATLPGSR